MTDLDTIPVADEMFIGIATDDTGRALIGLDARALDALDDLLDGLPLYHDMITDGYSEAAAEIASALRAAVDRHLRR